MRVQAPIIRNEEHAELIKAYPAVQQLFTVLNQFNTQVAALLNGGLSFKENMNHRIKEISIAPNQKYPFEVAHDLPTKPIGYVVLETVDVTDLTPVPVANVTLAAYPKDPTHIVIKDVAGLASGKKYRITVLIVGG